MKMNKYFDKFARPQMRIFKMSISSYQVCGYTGLILGILLGMGLAVYKGLSLWTLLGLTGTSMLTFLGLVMITKIITGEERIIYYHHEIAIMIMAGLFLKLLKQPVLPYLDLTILGIGTFLACGRVGCLMVGCCHGRPHKWGVCYRKEHADAGFTHYYVGIRLFPIQAVESLWVFSLVIGGTIFVLGKYPPGEALAWYVINYDMGRFILEFFRGDPERPYYGGYSEGQWISLILMGAVVWGELAGVIVFHLWHVIVTAMVAVVMIAVAIARHYSQNAGHQLVNPRHVREIARAIEQVSSPAGSPAPLVLTMNTTSQGIRLSAGKINESETAIDHYAFSSKKGIMNKDTAGTLADLIIQLRNRPCSKKLITHNRGVFHLFIYPLQKGGSQ